MTAECRSCRAPMEWAKTVPAGRSVPLDPEPVEPDHHGALVLVPGRGGPYAYGPTYLATRLAEKEGVSMAQAAALILERYEYRVSHFGTCPNADRHRRG